MDFDYTNETITPDTTGSINIGGTGAFGVPIGTTAQAPTSAAGLIRYDSSINQLTWCNASTWTVLSTGNAFKPSVLAATTANISTVSTTATTMTGTTVVFPAQDGITLSLNSRLLVKDQTTPAQNGVYTLTTVGVNGTTAWVLTRSIDADTIIKLSNGMVAVDSGATNGGIAFKNTTKTTDTLGSTAINWNIVVDAVYLAAHAATITTTTVVATVPNTVIDSYSVTLYRSSKYEIQITDVSGYHVVEIRSIHDGTNAYLTQYGEMYTTTSSGVFTTAIAGGNVVLYFTPIAASATVLFTRASIIV